MLSALCVPTEPVLCCVDKERAVTISLPVALAQTYLISPGTFSADDSLSEYPAEYTTVS